MKYYHCGYCLYSYPYNADEIQSKCGLCGMTDKYVE